MSCGVGTAAGVLGVSLALACSSSDHGDPHDGGHVHPSTGGVTVTGGSPSTPQGGSPGALAGAGAGASAGAGGGDAGSASQCPERESADPAATLLRVPIELMAGGQPFELGASYPLTNGEYSVSALAFFLSKATLVRTNGERVPARFADPSGALRPYDLHLVAAADPTSLSVDLLAPAGDYQALELGVGVPQGCNHMDPTKAVYPLNASSGMYWTWASGYMFIRLEGATTSGSDVHTFAYHVGFDPVYRSVVLSTPIAMPTTTPPRLVLDVTRVMGPADNPGTSMHASADLAVAERFAAEGTLVLSP
jgi:hypothetical protein